VAPRLMAYGRALDYEGRWRLAADVFGTLVAHAHPTEDGDLAVDANMQLGYCARMLGDWRAADAAYRRAGEVAQLCGDVVKVLRARIGDAKLAIDRGNLPRAEAILDETIGEAGRRELVEERARALQDRADVAYRRGQYERAVQLGYEALSGLTDPAARDRALSDVAVALTELGVRSAARDAHLILAATAQEQYSRWIAVVNLIELATLDRCEPVFEQYRRELAEAPLPPTLEWYYHYYVGRGYQAFGRPAEAGAALEYALDVATRHGLNKFVFDAEQALAELARGAPTEFRPEPDTPDGVREVAHAIGRWRAASLAGHDG
jgi:tetratricopeptide (TPR) repeat protein